MEMGNQMPPASSGLSGQKAGDWNERSKLAWGWGGGTVSNTVGCGIHGILKVPFVCWRAGPGASWSQGSGLSCVGRLAQSKDHKDDQRTQ